MTATLRPMTTGDISAVLRLEKQLFGDEAWSRAMLAGELARQPQSRHYLVAEEDGVIAGYGGLLVAGSQGDVLTLAVAGHRWGQGTGSALLEALLAEAARRGCTEVFLEVRIDNARAQQLYLRYGFTQIGVRRGYYQPSGTDALVMRKGLSPDSEDAGPAAGTARPAAGTARPAAGTARPAAGTARPAAGSAPGGGNAWASRGSTGPGAAAGRPGGGQ